MNQPAVNSLWIGKKLSSLELLTLLSFIHHGHSFHLWVYEPLSTQLPKEVVVRNAEEILPREKVFRYRYQNEFGHGKNSYAGFSDLFRARLLYQFGGWYVDMDVCCLRPLDFPEPYFFRGHHMFPVVGNVMKCPKGAEVMLATFEASSNEIDQYNRDWQKPISILNQQISRYQLDSYIRNNVSAPDIWEEIRPFIQGEVDIPSKYFFLHWMNEEWRFRKLKKSNVRKDSTLCSLYEQYGVPYTSFSPGPAYQFRESDSYRDFANGPFLFAWKNWIKRFRKESR